MSGFYIKEFDEVTDDVLKEGINALQKELNKRKAARKEKLILDFNKAFTALMLANIEVTCEGETIINFDSFEFYD